MPERPSDPASVIRDWITDTLAVLGHFGFKTTNRVERGEAALAALAALQSRAAETEAALAFTQAEEAKWRQACVSDSFQRSQAAYDEMDSRLREVEAERDKLKDAAGPLARLPLPVSSDERVDWLTHQQHLRAVLASPEAAATEVTAGLRAAIVEYLRWHDFDDEGSDALEARTALDAVLHGPLAETPDSEARDFGDHPDYPAAALPAVDAATEPTEWGGPCPFPAVDAATEPTT